MSLSLTYQPTLTLPEITLPTVQSFRRIFRTTGFKIFSEVFTLLIIVAAAAVWTFVGSAYTP